MYRGIRRWLARFGGGAAHLERGRVGERLAARLLRRKGYRLVARNIRTTLGEIDLLARDPDGRTLVVVEVKTAHAEALAPEYRVGRAKQRKLSALAGQLARRHRVAGPIRFDVVAVRLPQRGRAELRHYPGAFECRL